MLQWGFLIICLSQNTSSMKIVIFFLKKNNFFLEKFIIIKTFCRKNYLLTKICKNHFFTMGSTNMDSISHLFLLLVAREKYRSFAHFLKKSWIKIERMGYNSSIDWYLSGWDGVEGIMYEAIDCSIENWW